VPPLPGLRELAFLLVDLDGAGGVGVHLRLRVSANLVTALIRARVDCTPNSLISSHSTAAAATACRAPRTARKLTVSCARHLPSLMVRVIRARA
jgi:hypothetical protein